MKAKPQTVRQTQFTVLLTDIITLACKVFKANK